MRIVANGNAVELEDGATLDDLLTALGLGAKWVVVERNGEPVPRRETATTILAEGDRLELVRAVAGGADQAPLTLGDRRLYLCTADRDDLEPFIEACIAGGVDLVQFRDKELDARSVIERALLARRVCHDHGVPFILNDRPDLALEVEADGVHVGQEDAPASLARRLLGPDAIIGLSTHAPPELDQALEEPVDYISAGPVSPTPTKPGRPGTGIRYLTYVVERAKGGAPWFVTGGVTPESVKLMAAAGARRFVVVRWLTEAEDPKAAATAMSEAIDRAISRP